MTVKDSKGFTLIEIVTVVVVLGIIGAFTFSFINHAVTTYVTGNKQRMLYQEASYIMERITRELRDAQSVTIDTATLTITKAHVTGSMDTSTNIVFIRDANNNMLRSSGGVDRIMGKNVVQFTPSPSGTCASSDCSITIVLKLSDPNIPINDETARSVTLTTSVTPKNFNYGYTGRCFNGDYEDVIQ